MQRYWGRRITSGFPSYCGKMPSSKIKYSCCHLIGWPYQQALGTLAIGSVAYCKMLAGCLCHRLWYIPNFEGNCIYLLVFGNGSSVLCIGDRSCSMLDFKYRAFKVLLAPAPICYLTPSHFNTGWKYSRRVVDRRIEKLSQRMLDFLLLSKPRIRKSCLVVYIVWKHATGKCNL